VESASPGPGVATPMTYRVRPNGKQFVVIAAGGHGKLPVELGDALMAFTLPWRSLRNQESKLTDACRASGIAVLRVAP